MRALSGYWLRELGFSCRMSRIKPLTNLAIGEQVFAAVLRSDGAKARELLAAKDACEGLVKLAKETQFSRLTLDRLFELDLVELVPPERRAELSGLALRETAIEQRTSNQLQAVVARLNAADAHVVWIKGVAVARTAYSNISHRHFADFDIVVKIADMDKVTNTLCAFGFEQVLNPEFCNQYGVGPTSNFSDLFLCPVDDLIPSSALTMLRPEWAMIDVKASPCDTGIRMREWERFFSQCQTLDLGGLPLTVPSRLDQLLICINSLERDRFRNWKTLFDIHLLVNSLKESNALWQQFVRICRAESMQTSAWAGLCLANDRFHSDIPQWVLQDLAPKYNALAGITAFTKSPYFVWNATSLAAMLFDCAVSPDGRLKLSLLQKAFFPSQDFLSRYYSNGRHVSAPAVLILLLLHWCVLILPGGVVRRTIGNSVWPQIATAP